MSFRRGPVRRSPSCVGGLGTAARPLPVQADSLLRPFARRRASTRRPPREAMRARKPCSRFRARFLGWYVCFAISPCSTPLRSAVPTLPGPSNTTRAGGCQPHAMDSWPGFAVADSTGGSRRPSNLAARGPRLPIVGSEKRLLHYRDPQGRMLLRRLPARPGGVRFRTPLTVAQRTGDWFIDGCEAGMARRPR